MPSARCCKAVAASIVAALLAVRPAGSLVAFQVEACRAADSIEAAASLEAVVASQAVAVALEAAARVAVVVVVEEAANEPACHSRHESRNA